MPATNNPKGRGSTIGPSIHRLIAAGWSRKQIIDTLRCSRRAYLNHTNGACKCDPAEWEQGDDPALSLAPLLPVLERLRLAWNMPELTLVELDAMHRPIAEFYEKVMRPSEAKLTVAQVKAIMRGEERMPPTLSTPEFLKLAEQIAETERRLTMAETAEAKRSGVDKKIVLDLVDRLSTHQRNILPAAEFGRWVQWLKDLLEQRYQELL